MRKIGYLFKVFRLLLMNRVIGAAEVSADYDRLSSGYDEFFSKYMAPHSMEMLERLGLKHGMKTVDLACGTGMIACACADAVGAGGSVHGFDRSLGMLGAAKRRARMMGLSNMRLEQSDMLDGLAGEIDGSLDAVTCGWAIGYVNPQDLVCIAARKLKPGGRIGIIENARNTLEPIKVTAEKVAESMYSRMLSVMDLHFRLPKSEDHLGQLYRRAGLEPLDLWSGEQMFEFGSGAEVLDWVLHTGASAGFDKMMESSAKEECDRRFIQFIERDYKKDGKIKVAHKYVAGIGMKEN
jgi:ubiquinone/menaquinone biosynthesis C-methylase UbiE